MKALLIGALLALTPVAAYAALPADTDPVTTEELMARGKICVKVLNGELTADQVIKGLELDTDRKVRDFVIQCQMLFLGIEAGQQGSKPRNIT